MVVDWFVIEGDGILCVVVWVTGILDVGVFFDIEKVGFIDVSELWVFGKVVVVWVDVFEGIFVECFVLGKEMVGREWVFFVMSGGLVWDVVFWV